jgi:SNF2 family DNA or RNA helicase
MDEALIAKLRDIRSRENITLKPSPFLRQSYLDEYGEEKRVSVRNYQAQMIMNLLMMESMVCGDDTGLGKTLSALSTVGYVWMNEPEYVPVIVTTKSALFQWAGEVKKFMQGMEAVVVNGQPFKRHALYEDFFLGHDPAKKRLILMTYDHVMYDMEASVIKEKSRSPRKGFTREMDEARAEKKAATVSADSMKDLFQKQFSERDFDVTHYVQETLREGPGGRTQPPGWSAGDTKVLAGFIFARERLSKAVEKLEGLKREAAPPKKVPGLSDYVQSLQSQHPSSKVFLVFDEIHKLKNHQSQFHKKSAVLSRASSRVVGLTATPVKNRLMEFFAIFKIVRPSLFPLVSHFQNEFCVTKIQDIGGGRKVPIVVGYKNLDSFVRRIEPFYLSRKKHDVAKELPKRIDVEVECELLELQEELYDMAEAGALEKGDDPDATSSDLLSSMTMCQQAANSPRLIANEDGVPFDGPSSKIDALMDLLEEAEEQKMIVFSRFEKMVSAVAEELERRKIKHVRITGKESDPKKREKAKSQFQDTRSGIDVILITTAGAESINLQSAQHFVFLDLPWSWGDYVQLLGRMERIGSSHVTVVAHHFLSRKRGGGSTIDHYVLKALRSKKKLADKVAGESLKGGLQLESSDVMGDVFSQIRAGRPAVVPSAAAEAPKGKKLLSKKSKAVAGSVPEPKLVRSVELDLSDL